MMGGTDGSARLTMNQASGRRRYIKAFLLLALALGAGFVLGVSSTVLYFEKYHPVKGPRRAPEEMAEGMVKRIGTTIAINDNEREELKGLITSTLKDVEEVREGFSDQMHHHFGQLNNELERVLGSDRYTVWREARDKYFAEQAKRDRGHWYHRRQKREHDMKRKSEDRNAPSGHGHSRH